MFLWGIKLLSYFYFVLVKVFLLCFSILGFIIQLQLFALFYVYKQLVIFVAERQDMEILSPMSTILSDDKDFSTFESTCSIITVLRMDKKLSLKIVRQIFSQNVLNTNENIYPELKQYQVDYLGYKFWKLDSSFSINNHITEENIEEAMTLSEIHEKFVNRKFRRRNSPWEIIMLQTSNNSILVFRIHHSLADAKSVNKLIIERFAGKKMKSASVKYDGLKNYGWRSFYFFMMLPYNLTKFNYTMLWIYWRYKNHPWLLHCASSRNFSKVTDTISLENIKIVAKSYGCQTSAVIMAGVSSVITKYISENASVRNRFGLELPVYYTLPKPGHPSYLVNHLYIGFPFLPTNQLLNFSERLCICNEIYARLQLSPEKHYIEQFVLITSTLVKPMRRLLAGLSAVPTGISNIAGDQEGFQINGKNCSSYSMSYGPGPSTHRIGVSFTIHSYKGDIVIAVVAGSKVLKRHEVNQIALLVQREFEGIFLHLSPSGLKF